MRLPRRIVLFMKIEEIFDLEEGQGGLHSLMGVNNVYYNDRNQVCVEMKITPQLLNPAGKVHGGTIAALGDIAIGCYFELKKVKAVALNCETHYYRPGEPDSLLTATVTERKLGNTVSTFLIEITDEKNRLIADSVFSTFQR